MIIDKKLLVMCVSLLLGLHTMLCAQEHSATTAICWSLIPGGGQVYNHQAWKIPIIYGAFAGVGYFVYTNYQDMKMFKDEYLYRKSHNDESNLEAYAAYQTSNIYSLYNTSNRYFQLSVIIAVGVYALNLVDAYVFGHLFDFKIDDDISLAMRPQLQSTPLGWMPVAGFTLAF